MIFGNRFKKPLYLFVATRLFSALLLLFILDFSIGHALRYFYFKQICGREYRATYSINKTTDDILVFGSSRAYHQYVPDIVEEKLQRSCYNTGSPGQFIVYNYAVFKAVIKRYTPALIILDISPGDLKVDRDSYDRLSFLLPYYKGHPEIRPIVDLKGPLEKFKLISSIYPFNSSILMMAGGNLEYFKKKTIDIKGYKPLYESWNKPIENRIVKPYPIDSVKINILRSFIKDCREKDVKLFLVCSPLYIKFSSKEYSILTTEKIAKEENTPFIDFINDSSFTHHPHFFDDPEHLNYIGAKVFTNQVVDSIKKIIKSPY